jgi:DNA-binding SARP family transcriptional activator
VDFKILGPLEVARDGRAIPIARIKERALLAVLLLSANEVVSTDRLVDRLWGGTPPPTAGKALQVCVSRLRKALGAQAIVTRAPGYLLSVEPGELDLHRFEQLVAQAQGADSQHAAELLREALSLWRGAPLADVAYEAFAQMEIARLEELRFAALEQRIDVELALGRDQQLVGELEGLVGEYPLRERLRGQLMLALYRSGRQAEALAIYEDGRRLLDDELGLEPSESLKRLQRAILAHDDQLEHARDSVANAPASGGERSILVVVRRLDGIGAVLSLGEVLARSEPPHELVLVHVASSGDVGPATALLHEQRSRLLSEGLVARAAAFASPSPADDVLRLESQYDVDLIVLDAGTTDLDVATLNLLGRASCDVALLVEAGGPPRPGAVVVPFGAAEHDWAALELGAWIARATGGALRLIGAAAGDQVNGRDASRLLADASLIVQRTAGVAAEPLLASPGRRGVIALAEGAGLLVVGLPERWREEGLGTIRSEIAGSPPAPTVFVRRGVRPGGLAPNETRTRFTWSLTTAPAR